jgi:DNA-binding transcriptional regulator YiaG
MPAIIRFLRYSPLPPAESWAERLVRGRTIPGLSEQESAAGLDVDQNTLARWERGQREPTGKFHWRVLRFVAKVEGPESQIA